MKLIIGSLPRSGSAWLSAALCAQGPLAAHEGLHEILEGNMAWDDVDAVVGSDVLAPSRQLHLPSDAKLFYLFRRPEECAESLYKCGAYNYDSVVTTNLWAERFISLYKPEILSYYNLAQSVRRICQVAGVDVNETVLEQFVNMRITSAKYPDSV